LLKKNAATNHWQHAILALGVSVCLIGALVMVVGESIFGENHTGIATVIGIVGIGLIGCAGALIAGARARSSRSSQ
jgi:hypothetical protein